MPKLKFGTPTPDPDRGCVTQTVKRGRAFYGHLDTYPGGFGGSRYLRIYWAVRRPDEIFSKVADGAWAIDVETIKELKVRQVDYIGIEVLNGDRYITTLSNFTDKELGAIVLNYADHVGTAPGAKRKKGALQWYLPIYAFAKKLAAAEEAEAVTAAMIMIGAKPKPRIAR